MMIKDASFDGRLKSASGIANLAETIRSVGYITANSLSDEFQPGPQHVICSRGQRALKHSGNKRFRGLIRASADAYDKACTKLEKSAVVTQIIDSIREGGGGFVRQQPSGAWCEVGDGVAREKVGQL